MIRETASPSWITECPDALSFLNATAIFTVVGALAMTTAALKLHPVARLLTWQY